MPDSTQDLIADVISVMPGKVKIQLNTRIITNWETAEWKLKVWSFLNISDSVWIKLIAIIENFNISLKQVEEIWPDGTKFTREEKIYIIEAMPLGTIEDGVFTRWGSEITIPPKWARPSEETDILTIYQSQIDEANRFSFARLVQNPDITVFVDGNKFFNKHFSVVGSTWSGKSHTLARILQNAIEAKNTWVGWINNSHIVLFDIHWEYKTAFTNPNYIDISSLILPYWLLNSEELEELFLESGDFNNYNQSSILRNLITQNKKIKNPTSGNIHFDSPIKFDINEILIALKNLSKETRKWTATSFEPSINWRTINATWELDIINAYFEQEYEFDATQRWEIIKWINNDGSLEKFIMRLDNKLSDQRLQFLLWTNSKTISFQDTVRQFLGYKNDWHNITLIDLSWVPFEALAITVSLITRLLFEYWYYYKKMNTENMDNPLLLVYEEAHKYVPKNGWAKYNSVRNSIERVAKEWRKYWVTLWIVTQRPSEISETIFSQCSNFVAMRLTNPDDQAYVKKLLPDSLWWLIDTLPNLRSWEAILMGDSLTMPSLVVIDKCGDTLKPNSNDIPYLEHWKDAWKNIDFDKLEAEFKS